MNNIGIGEFPLDFYKNKKELGQGASAVVSLHFLDASSVSFYEINRRFQAYFKKKEASFELQKWIAVKELVYKRYGRSSRA